MTLKEKITEYENLLMETKYSGGNFYFCRGRKAWVFQFFGKPKIEDKDFEVLLDKVINHIKENRNPETKNRFSLL